MRPRRSKALPLLCALLALAIAFASWSALRETEAAVPDAPSGDVVDAPSDATQVSTPLVELPEDSKSKASVPEASPVASQERVAVATAEELELADAIWISGRLTYPEGTPIGEQIDVIANGRAFKSREPYRARVEPSGIFRVAFAKGTRSGNIEIDAPHLFLTDPQSLKIKDGKPTREVLLQPILGACVQGQLRLPAQAQDSAQRLVGDTVNSWGWSDSAGESCTRSAKIGTDLRFELRGLDPRVEHQLSLYQSFFAPVSFERLKVEAGETKLIYADLTLGVSLRGRVTCAEGALPKHVSLSALSMPLRSGSGALDSDSDSDDSTINVAEDGSFEGRGIAPGSITLVASGDQRTDARLELGVLGDGELREGIELALGMGGQIGGHVRWPDGKAAAGASVELEAVDDDDDPDIGRVLTGDDGGFMINGLEGGPFKLLALAESDEKPAAKSRQRAPKWSAQVESVPVGTPDLSLVLHGGYSVNGVALDDSGAPLERFTVRATPEGVDSWDDSKTISARISAKDGRFELLGLLEGAHQLRVTASRHEQPDPQRILVPDESGPFTFVAVRRGSISGFVQLPDGTPAARATLHVISEEGMAGASSRANSQGEFKLSSVSAGSFSLRAKLKGYGASEATALQLAPGKSIDGVQLVLRRSARISGEVHPSRQGETTSGREIHSYLKDGSSSFECSTDAKGLFVLEGVDPGEYTVQLQPSPEEMKSLTRPDASEEQARELKYSLLRSATVKVEEGGEAHVVFGTREGASIRITGSVFRGESPQSFVQVRAMPDGALDDRDALYALSDDAGRFELAVARAGKYLVQAFPGGLGSMPTGEVFEVPAGGLEGVKLLVSGGRLYGKVHVKGTASSGWIQLTLERSGQGRASDVAGHREWPDADFNFDSLPAGTYTLTASAWAMDEGQRPSKRVEPLKMDVVLSEDQVLELQLELVGP